MQAKTLLTSLKKKLDINTDRELTETIGITRQTLIRWRSNGDELDASQIASIIKKAIKRGEGDARRYSIKPIVEYYPIEATRSRRKWELLDLTGVRQKKIKDHLLQAHGIYAFYNSQLWPIYVGKAKQHNLWDEMKSAFNRARGPQVLWRVKYPRNGADFLPACQQPRRIMKTKVCLHDIAHFFSAFTIEKDLIDNEEALLIRMFANVLTNEQMENIELKQRN